MYTLVLGKYYSMKDIILNSFRIENVVEDNTHDHSILIDDENNVIDFNHNEETYMSLLRHVAMSISTDDDTNSDTNDTFELDKELEYKYFKTICEKVSEIVNDIIDDYPDLNEKFKSENNDDAKIDIVRTYYDFLCVRIICENWPDIINSVTESAA